MPALTSPRDYIRKHTAKKSKHILKPTVYPLISSHAHTTINPQHESPLLCLPAEIRHEIFTYTLLAYSDQSYPLSKHTYHYRPAFPAHTTSFTHARRIATNLLLSCRRIYLETYLLPVQLNEHIIYGCETSHAPPTFKGAVFPKCKLRREQWETVKTCGRIHIFAQQYWLEDFNNREGGFKDFCCAVGQVSPGSTKLTTMDAYDRSVWAGSKRGWVLRITIRHTDWWYYLLGAGSPLALDPKKAGRARRDSGGEAGPLKCPEVFQEGSWGSRFRLLKGLGKLELELETLRSKRQELEKEVVSKAYSWGFELGDGNILQYRPEETQWFEWKGSACFKGLPKTAIVTESEQQGNAQFNGGRRSTLASLRSSVSVSSRTNSITRIPITSEPEYETLDYSVVILTFRAQRPDEDPDPPLHANKTNTGEGGEEREENSDASSTASASVSAAPVIIPSLPLANAPARRSAGRNAIPTAWG